VPASIGPAIASILIGIALAFAAPSSWKVGPFHGALLGSAFYVAALRHTPAMLPRAVAFLLLAGAQVYVLFVAAPGADLRATFIILSSWIVVESVAGRSTPVAKRASRALPV